MTPPRWERLKEIFAQAVEIQGEERDKYIAEACRGDPGLLQEVRVLLAGDERSNGFLSNPVVSLRGGDASPPLFEPGQSIAGRFRIGRFIARGGMGEIYEAEDMVLAENVALKAIRPMVVAGHGIEHLKQEIHAARRVTHPNVCRTFDIVECGDPVVTLATMELLEGPTLARYLHMHGPFSRREALPLIRQIIAGLQAAHDAGVIHRDFKSGNVILAGSQEALRPVITDFGLAHTPDSARAGSAERAGTPGYMAPEQWEGGPISPATDIYSLGVVIAEMVGARRPDAAAGSPPSSSPGDAVPRLGDYRKELGPWLPVIERCLQKDPVRRYQKAADLGAALERASASPISRHRLWSVTAAVVIVGAMLWWLAGWRSGPREPAWLLVAALDNRAGEPMLDESVPYLLEREISTFPDLYIVQQNRVEDALRLMKKDSKGRVDEALAREVCRRDGGIHLIAGCMAERVNGEFTLTAWLTDAVSGRQLGRSSDRAQKLEDVGQGVRRLAAAVRRAAGQRNAGSPAEFERLEKVVTPSLRACRLYSQSCREGQASRWQEAERSARAALAEDPQFASAHIWLYRILGVLGKNDEERQAHLIQAVAYSESATPREREFILTLDKIQDTNRIEERVAAWRQMLAHYPDDFWARSDLAEALYHLGMDQEAAVERYWLAEMAPESESALLWALRSAVETGNQELAVKYRNALKRLEPETPAKTGMDPTFGYVAGFDLHQLWLAGRFEELQDLLTRYSAGKRVHQPLILYSLLTLGKLREAQSYAADKIMVAPKEQWAVATDYIRDDETAMHGDFERMENPEANVPAAVLSVRPDWDQAQLQHLIEAMRRIYSWPQFVCVESRFAALHADLATAASKYEECRQQGPVTFFRFILAAALARAYENAGDDARALSVIEGVDYGPGPMVWRTYYWHRIRYERARYLRKVARLREAEEIEESLRRELRLADSDHPILVRLKEAGRRPFNIY